MLLENLRDHVEQYVQFRFQAAQFMTLTNVIFSRLWETLVESRHGTQGVLIDNIQTGDFPGVGELNYRYPVHGQQGLVNQSFCEWVLNMAGSHERDDNPLSLDLPSTGLSARIVQISSSALARLATPKHSFGNPSLRGAGQRNDLFIQRKQLLESID